MTPNFYERAYVCKSCDEEFIRVFDGKKPPKLKKQKCFCPFCGKVAVAKEVPR